MTHATRLGVVSNSGERRVSIARTTGTVTVPTNLDCAPIMPSTSRSLIVAFGTSAGSTLCRCGKSICMRVNIIDRNH